MKKDKKKEEEETQDFFAPADRKVGLWTAGHIVVVVSGGGSADKRRTTHCCFPLPEFAACPLMYSCVPRRSLDPDVL